jgi:YgiT-type zinc finger domain-containing protein
MKTCYFCKGRVTPRIIEYMAHRRGEYMLVRNLPVEACEQCGEVYLDPSASRRVDEAFSRKANAQQRLQVPVINVE